MFKHSFTDRLTPFLTERAQEAVFKAKEEAIRLENDYIGTEHLLLGLIRVNGGVAADAIKSFGVSLEDLGGQIEEIVDQNKSLPEKQIFYTSRAKSVFTLSRKEASRFGNDHISTGHILIGLIRKNRDITTRILAKNIDVKKVRRVVRY